MQMSKPASTNDVKDEDWDIKKKKKKKEKKKKKKRGSIMDYEK